jgi:hypothetical protein
VFLAGKLDQTEREEKQKRQAENFVLGQNV